MKRITSKDVPCPTCWAEAGRPCRGSIAAHRGHRARSPHAARIQFAKDRQAERERSGDA